MGISSAFCASVRLVEGSELGQQLAMAARRASSNSGAARGGGSGRRGAALGAHVVAQSSVKSVWAVRAEVRKSSNSVALLVGEIEACSTCGRGGAPDGRRRGCAGDLGEAEGAAGAHAAELEHAAVTLVEAGAGRLRAGGEGRAHGGEAEGGNEGGENVGRGWRSSGSLLDA